MFFIKKRLPIPAYKRTSSRRFLLREIPRRCNATLDETKEWIDYERECNYNDVFYLKLYFEWKFDLKKDEFSFEKLKDRVDEDEFVEILLIVEEVLGIKYNEFPFSFETVLNKLREEINGGKQQHNSRENCYIWSNE